ncbi:MAG: HD family phosphohydrolase [Dissulfuribacterales bacterium]
MNTKPSDISIKKHFSPDFWILLGILFSVTIISSLILFPNLDIIRINYRPGDIADKNIKATADFYVVDTKTTGRKRKQARKDVLTVYDYDKSMLGMLKRQINQAFEQPRSIYKAQKPITDTDKKSPTTETKKMQQADIHNKILQLKPKFEKIIGIPVNNGAYQILEKEKFSKEISDLIVKILSKILQNGVVANKDLLLRENDKGISLKTVGSDSEKIITNLKHFYGLDQAKTMVRIEGGPILKDVDYTLVNLIVDFTQRLIQPNITLNRSETENRRKIAEESIKSILYKFRRGEMILREGEPVTPLHLLQLNELRKQTGKQQVIKKGIGTGLIIFALLTITYLIHLKFQKKILHYQNKNLFFIGSVVILFLLILKLSTSLALAPEAPFPISPSSIFYGIPLSAGAMTICQFLGFNVAFPFAIVLALISAIIFEHSYELCLFFLLSGIMGAYWVQDCKERQGFIKAGVKIGLLNILLATGLDIYMVDFSGFKLLADWTFAFFGGVIAGILTAGLAPLMELSFGYTTDSALYALANLDQPLLRRLMLEAPGTYHHSVIVGSLAETAASEIGANPLMAKVCGYYHDIGKLKNPLYFIENQKDGKNIHNKLAPSMSCLILISHVKNGIELAKKNKLGLDILDAIKQHHGTTLISFFYDKAKKQQKEDQAVNIDNFRYPGPKPQTRETALVMLADVIEAASRSLEDPTAARIQGLVQQLINKLFSDNQLDECPLTLKDLNNIARSFNKILNGIYHHRIEYPEKFAPGEPKEKNGHNDRQQTKTAQNINATDTENSSSTLKRLGQS